MSASRAALLSPEVAGPRSRPLRSWSALDRERITRSTDAALRQWRSAWGLPEPTTARDALPEDARAGIRCASWCDGSARELAPEPGEWRPIDGAWGLWWAPFPRAAGSARGASRSRDAVFSSLARALFGDPTQAGEVGGPSPSAAALENSPTLAGELVREAWADCSRRLAAALATSGPKPAGTGESVEPGAEVLRPWSGAVLVTVPWWGPSLSLLVAGERVGAFLGSGGASSPRRADGPSGGLAPVWRVLAGRPARLHVQTKPFELELGALAALRVGDVICTTHLLDLPLAVTIAGPDDRGSDAICGAYLGKLGAARAVELMPFGPREAPSAHRITEPDPATSPSPSTEPEPIPSMRDTR